MKRIAVAVLVLVNFLGCGSAFGFVDQITHSPQMPTANRPVTISFRSGVCEGVIEPLDWELRGTGSVRDLVVNGITGDQSPQSCGIPAHTTSIPIHGLPEGTYTIHIMILNPFDGVGIPSPSFGSTRFTVGVATPIPSSSFVSLAMLGAILFALALIHMGRDRDTGDQRSGARERGRLPTSEAS